MGAGEDVEAQPLLASSKDALKVPLRTWKHGWHHVLGDGSAEDTAACCLAWHAPAVAFGWNASRGLGSSWWREALKFLVLTLGVFVVLRCAACGVVMAFCGQPMHGPMPGMGADPMPMPMPMMDGRPMMDGPMRGGAAGVSAAASGMMGGGRDGGMMGGMMGPDPGFERARMDQLLGDDATATTANVVVETADMIAVLQEAVEVATVTVIEVPGVGVYEVEVEEGVQGEASGRDGKKPCKGKGKGMGRSLGEHEEEHEGRGRHGQDHGHDGRGHGHDGHRHHQEEHGDEEVVMAVQPVSIEPYMPDNTNANDEPMALTKPWMSDRMGRDGPHPHPHHPHHPMLTEECMLEAGPRLCALAALGITVLAYTMYWASLRRTALRERFGIAGSRTEDCAVWACCAPCALAQETRTLMHNNVTEGLWHGPLLAPQPQQHSAYTVLFTPPPPPVSAAAFAAAEAAPAPAQEPTRG